MKTGLEILNRLARFNPKRIRFCECPISHIGNTTCMKYHFVRKCNYCRGKIFPEHWQQSKEYIERLKLQIIYHN